MPSAELKSSKVETKAVASSPGRIVSIDATRGLVMLVMIFVNDLDHDVREGLVPWWMKHFRGPTGITFVDLVFPGFLFIVGMSIPFALSGRVKKGEPPWKTFLHVVARTLSLLAIGILMVNGTPDRVRMGWSGDLWETLMFLCAMLAFCSISPPGKLKQSTARKKIFDWTSLVLRALGFAGLLILALVFRNKFNRPLLTLSPFYLHHIWYGILGYIAWAYLLGATAFLIFRTNLTALLGCAVLMMCLYPANRLGMFDNYWIGQQVNVGVAFGSRAAITALGVILGAKLLSSGPRAIGERVRFTLLLIAACAAAALLLGGLYGVSKELATPSWSLWGCVATAALWLLFYFIADVSPVNFIAKPFSIAGENVLLAYLISEMIPSALAVAGLSGWYEHLADASVMSAAARSGICAVIVLAVATGLNRLGFRLRL
jgi:predicted acyltransferase